jgi:NAD(P)H-dependent nitrite reductase small subunit
MNEFVEVASASALPIGRAMACTVGERKIALFHTSDGFFATDNTCPHRGGPLAEGDVIGKEIVCPWHFWSFQIDTGVSPDNSEMRVATHEVKIDGDRILVRLS